MFRMYFVFVIFCFLCFRVGGYKSLANVTSEGADSICAAALSRGSMTRALWERRQKLIYGIPPGVRSHEEGIYVTIRVPSKWASILTRKLREKKFEILAAHKLPSENLYEVVIFSRFGHSVSQLVELVQETTHRDTRSQLSSYIDDNYGEVHMRHDDKIRVFTNSQIGYDLAEKLRFQAPDEILHVFIKTKDKASQDLLLRKLKALELVITIPVEVPAEAEHSSIDDSVFVTIFEEQDRLKLIQFLERGNRYYEKALLRGVTEFNSFWSEYADFAHDNATTPFVVTTPPPPSQPAVGGAQRLEAPALASVQGVVVGPGLQVKTNICTRIILSPLKRDKRNLPHDWKEKVAKLAGVHVVSNPFSVDSLVIEAPEEIIETILRTIGPAVDWNRAKPKLDLD